MNHDEPLIEVIATTWQGWGWFSSKKKHLHEKPRRENSCTCVFSPGPPRCGPILARPGCYFSTRKKRNENENIATAPRPAKEPRSDKRLSRASSNPVLSKRCQESTDGNVEKPLQGETVCKVTFYKVTFKKQLAKGRKIISILCKTSFQCM